MSIFKKIKKQLGQGKSFALWLKSIRPVNSFNKNNVPPAPDYSLNESWATGLSHAGNSVLSPQNSAPAPNRDSLAADVFFIHPTTFFSSANWNADIADEFATEMLEEAVIPGQASVLNGLGKIYTPRYRQATFYSFLSPKKDGEKALDVAYEDVAKAFDYFIKIFNSGKPFFILSHSQGTCHAIRLLAEKVENTPLAKKLVAAYCIGYRFPEELFGSIFKNLKPGLSPEATGVIIAWDTYVEGGIPAQKTDWCPVPIPQSDGNFHWERRSGKKPLCINPISFDSDQPEKAKQAHKGGSRAIPDKAMPSQVALVFGSKALGFKADHLSEVEKAMVSARVDKSGFLFISKPENPSFRKLLLPIGNYHNYDIALFYEDIRVNAALRWSSYLSDNLESLETQ